MQEVDERFGGNAAFKELVQAAHAGGMRVITDIVLKHVHQEHPIWKEQPEFFIRLELSDGKKIYASRRTIRGVHGVKNGYRDSMSTIPRPPSFF